MKNRISTLKAFLLLIVCCFMFSSNIIFSQEVQHKSTMPSHKMMKMKEMKHDSSSSKASVIVRKGIIDLKKIDVNRDGKVYQDDMDYNVISDKPGTCPLCGMTLKEVSLQKAKKNLIEAGFKVK